MNTTPFFSMMRTSDPRTPCGTQQEVGHPVFAITKEASESPSQSQFPIYSKVEEPTVDPCITCNNNSKWGGNATRVCRMCTS